MHKTYWKLKTPKTLGVLPSNEKNPPPAFYEPKEDLTMHTLKHVDARSGGEGGSYRGKHRDEDVQDFTPKGFVFHDVWCLIYDLWFMIYEWMYP